MTSSNGVAAQPWCNGKVGDDRHLLVWVDAGLCRRRTAPQPEGDLSSAAGISTFTRRPITAGSCGSCPAPRAKGGAGDFRLGLYPPAQVADAGGAARAAVKAQVAARLADPDVAAWPNLIHVLNYPIHHESWFDIITNEVDGPWYVDKNPINLAKNIDIPVYLQVNQGRGWTLHGTIELFVTLTCPKKLEICPYPGMQTRPMVDDHDTMFRWYDHG